MKHYCKRSPARFLGPLACLIALSSTAFLPGIPESIRAQTVSTPITRHPVLYWARQYTLYRWYQGGWHTSIPFAWGYYDWMNSSLGQGSDDCNAVPPALFQHRLDRGCDASCDSHAGVDCSGYVMRVWGLPTAEAKWGTATIAANSTLVPYAVRNDDLPIRMRMGDVFDDYVGSSRHVVLLYYFDPETSPVEPRFYEENVTNPPCAARLNNGGWDWLEHWWGWWNGQDGYRPYRYNEIRDDIYLPWLAFAWYGWESTLFARNTNVSPATYVLQHTIYGAGGDQSAINTGTYRRVSPLANDVWELPTSIILPQPPITYLGGGVVAADTGDDAVVLVQDEGTYGQGVAYSGIYPSSNLGLATANTLYMPVFLYNPAGSGRYSKIFLQNAGRVATDVTLTYYGDDGRICPHVVSNLQPWGMTIVHPEHCGWQNPSTPPGSGAVLLSANQPLAAITLEHVNYARNAGYNAFSQGSTTLYAPELLRNYWGWNSTLEVMNVGTGQTRNIQAKYYTYGGAYICTDYLATTAAPLLAGRHRSVNHGPGGNSCVSGYDLFSAVITSGAPDNQPIVAIVNQDNPTSGDYQSYNAFPKGQLGLVLPIIRKGRSANWEGNWSASIEVQNTSSAPYVNPVTMQFYDQAGRPGPVLSCNLGPRQSCMKYADIPDNYSGSVVIEADLYPVVALGSLINDNLGADAAMKYNATEQKGASSLNLPGEEPSE